MQPNDPQQQAGADPNTTWSGHQPNHPPPSPMSAPQYPSGYQPVPAPGYGGPPETPPSKPRAQPRGLSPFGMPARHRWEIPLLIVIVLLMVLGYSLALLLLLVGAMNQFILALVFAPLLIWFGRGANLAQQRVNGVKMSPTQFPEGYRLVQEAAARFGMKKAPDAYVVLGNGQINAFASGHGFRRYVVVYSDLFEIGGQAREPDGLAFIIGHEVGHIAAGHASYWRQLGMVLVPFIPILGSSLIRSQEFTADNHGYCNRHRGAPAAMGTLAAGKYMNKLVGFDEMADRAAIEKDFFVWITNATSTHPVLTWRMWALRDRSSHGRLFWRPNPPTPGGPPPAGHPYAPPPGQPYPPPGYGGQPAPYGEMPALERGSKPAGASGNPPTGSGYTQSGSQQGSMWQRPGAAPDQPPT